MERLKNIYHYFLAWLGGFVYGFPSRKIFVLGVTGTKGKSTTLELINAILEAAGHTTALLSSVRVKIGDESAKNSTSMTMPGRFFIQRFLKKAVDARCVYALIEVTSQGVSQHRHRFIDFDAALWTNLQPEHIEAHGSFEAYRNAKVKFFRDVAQKSKKAKKFFILNEEDPSKGYFEAAINGSGEIIYFSREDFIKNELSGGQESIGDWLSSDFNLENAAAAAVFTESQKIEWPLVKSVLTSFRGLAGRMEVVQKEPFKIIIDYAHTPDSLEKVYRSLKQKRVFAKKQALICVLGSAGGGRDKWKRPVMGKIAAEYCDRIILTNEDPYDESPSQILTEIKSGIPEPQLKNVSEILDRRDAIKKAISFAQRSDTIIITGKGSELWMHLAHGKNISWSEKDVVKEVLE